MKISVITRHAITNYGSLLQSLATQIVLNNMGYDCETVDYIRLDESYWRCEKTILNRKSEWNNNAIKKGIYLALRVPESVIAGRRFERKRHSILSLSDRYTSEASLNNNPPEADVYVTGSDQVWGPTADGRVDSAYCLSWVPDGKKKISYAASFGRTDMNNDMATYFRRWLGRYDYISVREDSAVNLMLEWGISAKQVLDPTLLLKEQEWADYIGKNRHKKYVLVYQLHNDKELGEYAKKVSDELGLPLIRVSATFHQITKPGKFIFCPDVKEFLSLIKNAECMITDSFHGTAFAINFHTPFVEKLPGNKTETRNMSILKLTGLEDRILCNNGDISLARRSIEWERVDDILDAKRKESLDILKNMIER